MEGQLDQAEEVQDQIQGSKSKESQEHQKLEPQSNGQETKHEPLNKIDQVLTSLQDKIDSIERRLSSVPQVSPIQSSVVSNDLDSEIELRKQQLSAIKRGEIDSQFEPEVILRMNSAQIKKEGQEIVQRESTRQEFLRLWDANLSQAYEEFPDLKDKNSELHKLAKEIVVTDPSFKRYQDVIKTTGADSKFDFNLLDSRVNLRAAREAYAILQKREASKPKSEITKNPGSAKFALEGKSGTVARVDELDRLEKDAIDSGDQTAWARYIKARDQHLKSRRV